MRVSWALKGGLGPMFIRVVTVSRMEILGPIIHRELCEICESGNGETTGWQDAAVYGRQGRLRLQVTGSAARSNR